MESENFFREIEKKQDKIVTEIERYYNKQEDNEVVVVNGKLGTGKTTIFKKDRAERKSENINIKIVETEYKVVTVPLFESTKNSDTISYLIFQMLLKGRLSKLLINSFVYSIIVTISLPIISFFFTTDFQIPVPGWFVLIMLIVSPFIFWSNRFIIYYLLIRIKSFQLEFFYMSFINKINKEYKNKIILIEDIDRLESAEQEKLYGFIEELKNDSIKIILTLDYNQLDTKEQLIKLEPKIFNYTPNLSSMFIKKLDKKIIITDFEKEIIKQIIDNINIDNEIITKIGIRRLKIYIEQINSSNQINNYSIIDLFFNEISTLEYGRNRIEDFEAITDITGEEYFDIELLKNVSKSVDFNTYDSNNDFDTISQTNRYSISPQIFKLISVEKHKSIFEDIKDRIKSDRFTDEQKKELHNGFIFESLSDDIEIISAVKKTATVEFINDKNNKGHFVELLREYFEITNLHYANLKDTKLEELCETIKSELHSDFKGLVEDFKRLDISNIKTYLNAAAATQNYKLKFNEKTYLTANKNLGNEVKEKSIFKIPKYFFLLKINNYGNKLYEENKRTEEKTIVLEGETTDLTEATTDSVEKTIDSAEETIDSVEENILLPKTIQIIDILKKGRLDNPTEQEIYEEFEDTKCLIRLIFHNPIFQDSLEEFEIDFINKLIKSIRDNLFSEDLSIEEVIESYHEFKRNGLG